MLLMITFRLVVLSKPGVATTTFSYLVELPSVDFLRVMTYGENLSTDPNDGVQMWLEAVKQLEL